jgi:hypothetical protein
VGKVGVELKLNPDTSEINRLVGQATQYLADRSLSHLIFALFFIHKKYNREALETARKAIMAFSKRADIIIREIT